MDFAQIETSKENVQPLAAGRNVKQLASQLRAIEEGNGASRTVSVFEEGCKEWEAKLTAAPEDPMAVWDEYIKWAQQHATSDKLQGHIVPLLQRCTRDLQRDARYKDDPRYLRAWIKYIDTVRDPSDIFAFLEANGIGQRLALFYSSWALVLELKKSMYAEAYAKIEEGINKKAEPLEQLQFALKQFQHRMNKRTMDAVLNNNNPPPAEPANPNAREFGDQLTKTRKVARPAGSVQGGATGTTRRAAPKVAQVKGTGSNAGFAIFCDGPAGGEAPAGGAWEALPGEKERSKENARAASKWTKDQAGTVPQKRARPAAAAAPVAKAGVDFELFRDEELPAEAPPQERRGVRLQLDGALGERRDQEAADRQERPLDFLNNNAAASNAQQDFLLPPSESQARTEGGGNNGANNNKNKRAAAAAPAPPPVKIGDYELPKHVKQRSEDGTGIAGYNRAMLALDGEVISIEEARALETYGMSALDGSRDWFGSQQAAVVDPHDVDGDADMEFSPPKPLSMMLVFHDIDDDNKHAHTRDLSPLSTAKLNIPDQTQPSPTISHLAPKSSGAKAASTDTATTPSFRNFKTVDTRRTPFTAGSLATPAGHSNDETGAMSERFGGNDISMIARAQNSTFFANTSRHTLCPGDANFTLQEEPLLQGGDENMAPSQLNFAASGAHEENFFQCAIGGSSPTINTKNAKDQVLDLMPSPTATVAFVRVSSPALVAKKAHAHAHHDEEAGFMPSPTITKEFFKNAVASPTVQTKIARDTAADLMPSPTETANFFRGAAAGASPTVNTKLAANLAFDLMPSPTRTFSFSGEDVARRKSNAFAERDDTSQHLFNEDPPSAAPAPSKASSVAAPSFGGFEIREDTNLKGFKADEAPPAAFGGFEIREDTNLKGFKADAAPEPSSGGFEIREDTNMKGLEAEAAPPPAFGGFEIREDTNLKGFKADTEPAPSSGGFEIREDTNLKGFKADSEPSSGGFEIREDTNMKGFTADAEPEPSSSGGLEIREDTNMTRFKADFEPAPSSGGFEIREDTNMKGFEAEAAPPAAFGGFEIREDTNLKGFDTENAAPAAVEAQEEAPMRKGLSEMERVPMLRLSKKPDSAPAPVHPADENAAPVPAHVHKAPEAKSDSAESDKGCAGEADGAESGAQHSEGAAPGPQFARTGQEEGGLLDSSPEAAAGAEGGAEGALPKGEDDVPTLCEYLNTIAEVSHDNSSFGEHSSGEAMRGRTARIEGSLAGFVLAEEDEGCISDLPSPQSSFAAGTSGNVVEPSMTPGAKSANASANTSANAAVTDSTPTRTDVVEPSMTPDAKSANAVVDSPAAIGWNRRFSDLQMEVGEKASKNTPKSQPRATGVLRLSKAGGENKESKELTPISRAMRASLQHSLNSSANSSVNASVDEGANDADASVGHVVTCIEGGVSVHADASVHEAVTCAEGGMEDEGACTHVDASVHEVVTPPEVGVEDREASTHAEGREEVGSGAEAEEASVGVAEEAEEASVGVAAEAEEASVGVVEEAEEASVGVAAEAEEASVGVAVEAEEASVGVAAEAQEASVGVAVEAEEASVGAAEEEEDASIGVAKAEDTTGAEGALQRLNTTSESAGALDTSGGRGDESLNVSTESGRARRARTAVDYKEKPINVKCRQGANPWHSGTADDSHSSLNASLNSSLHKEEPAQAPSPAGDGAKPAGASSKPADVNSCKSDEADAGPQRGGEGVAVQAYSRAETQAVLRASAALHKSDCALVRAERSDAPAVRVGSRLELGGKLMHVEGVRGRGAWSVVYDARVIRMDRGIAEGLDEGRLVALKVLTQEASIWEFHISRQLHERLAHNAKSSFLEISKAHLYRDTCILETQHLDQLTLQSVINAYRKAGKKMDEGLVMFYALELLRAVQACHAAGVLHGDIKPDNVMLRDADDGKGEWQYTPAEGFSTKGVYLIDYGCAIDLSLYKEGTVFEGKSGTEAFECAEMQGGRAWTKEVDFYAVAATVHCLLHNEYMAIEEGGGGRLRPKLPLKRYWQVDVWTTFFDSLINGGDAAGQTARSAIEGYFERNPAKASSMRMSLIKQDILVDQYGS